MIIQKQVNVAKELDTFAKELNDRALTLQKIVSNFKY